MPYNEDVRVRWAAASAVLAFAMTVGGPASASSVDELLASAQRHIAAGEEEIALRRYTDAIEIDPTCEACYLGLGALREKRGDYREADRVYTVALLRRLSPTPMLMARARARWAMAQREAALVDLEEAMLREPGADGLRHLVAYYGELRAVPAQLRVARQLLAYGEKAGDEAVIREARVLVAALAIVAGPADPVTQPIRPDATRRALSRAAH